MNRKELLQHAKPILFNTDMVRAILGGRKTVTRRLQSKRIENKWFDYEEFVNAVSTPESTSLTEKEFYEQYPPYQPGDVLYVRETWDYLEGWKIGDPSIDGKYFYKADGDLRPVSWRGNWRPSIHMPKEAARIFLKVTNVRVERLQCMSWDDICNEGIIPDSNIRDKFSFEMLCNNFKNLWNSTIKKSELDRYGWDANPWVWVVEFEIL